MKKTLTKKQLHDYREKLLNLKEQFIAQIREISENTLMKSQKDISGDMSGYSLHIADVATDNYERDFNLGLVSDERTILLEIEEALKMIEDRTYGICRACEKNIAKIRLNAIPYVKKCKKCQEKEEKETSA
ncbi:MAG: TraR/DksA C4-type zinc finger protein [Candidatus Omnitrophota bacterium]|nr:TraR/DksA C4-type zinc finger protein [Candidatus Omnitrophota bacterium]